MSFGFSISDIVGCAHLAFQLYEAFKQAPEACGDFAKELLSFHDILQRTNTNLEDLEKRSKDQIQYSSNVISDSDLSTLRILIEECNHLLCFKILKGSVPAKVWSDFFDGPYRDNVGGRGNFRTPLQHAPRIFNLQTPFFGKFQEAVQEAKFFKKIPQLQQAIHGCICRLVAFNTLFAQSYLTNIQAGQESQAVTISRIDLTTQRIEDTQTCMVNSQARIEDSQSRLDEQLAQVLAAQQRLETPLLSQSLNASSSEGRQTWMELGKLLREEGITPGVIRENHGKLVAAMKHALAESFPESFRTAREYLSATGGLSPPQIESITSLGTGPTQQSSCAIFPPSFLERHVPGGGFLDEQSNVVTGIESLVLGMEDRNNVFLALKGEEDGLEELLHDSMGPDDSQIRSKPLELRLENYESKPKDLQIQEGILKNPMHQQIVSKGHHTETNEPVDTQGSALDTVASFLNNNPYRKPMVTRLGSKSEDPNLIAAFVHAEYKSACSRDRALDNEMFLQASLASSTWGSGSTQLGCPRSDTSTLSASTQETHLVGSLTLRSDHKEGSPCISKNENSGTSLPDCIFEFKKVPSHEYPTASPPAVSFSPGSLVNKPLRLESPII